MGQPSTDRLNFQADRIERVLAAHRVPTRVHGGTVLPRSVRFLLTPAPNAKVSAVRGLTEELALHLGAEDVRIVRDGEHLAVEVPREDPDPVLLSDLLHQVPNIPPVTGCLGLTDEGRPLLLRLPSPDVAHVLIAGATGSGKTELMRSLVLSLALRNRQSKLQFALIDPKSRGFLPLAGLPHLLADIATDPGTALNLLERLLVEMERRDRANVAAPRIVIVIDELLDLLATGGKPVELALTRLAQRGREAGLHLVAGAQKPAATVLGAMLKANFPVRLVGRVGSAEDARVAAGVAGTNAERLLGRGDFMLIAAGHTVRFQAAWVPAAEWPELLSGLG
jgi:S-DNA-T family DNA segregation ATPase FtsK/SpoIIIE